MTIQQKVCVLAVRSPWSKSQPLIASNTPEMMYVPEIIGFRPTMSKSGPSTSGPHRLPTAKAMP